MADPVNDLGMAGNPGLGSAVVFMLACGLLAAPHASAPHHAGKARAGAPRAHLGTWKVRHRIPKARRGAPRTRSGSTAPSRSGSTAPSRFNLQPGENSSQAVRGGDTAHGRFSVRVTVQSLNDEAVTVFGVGRSGPGLKLLSSKKPVPHRLQPDRSTSFDLKYEVTDCGAVPKGDWPIPIRLERNGAPEVAYTSMRMVPTGPGYSTGESWQSVMSGEICGLRRSS